MQILEKKTKNVLGEWLVNTDPVYVTKLKPVADNNSDVAHNMVDRLINSLPNDNILDWSKLKAFAEDKTKVLSPLPDNKFYTLPN